MIQKTSITKGEESQKRKNTSILTTANSEHQPTKVRAKTSNQKTKSLTKNTPSSEQTDSVAHRTRRARTASASAARPRKTLAQSNKQTHHLTAEERYQMIAEAAYYIAESHGFDDSRTMQDWLEAELKIDEFLATKSNLINEPPQKR